MATQLNKPVIREANLTSIWFRSGRVEVCLHQGGFIGFREVGRRSQYKLNLAEAARQAVLHSINRIKAEEKKLRQEGWRRGAKREATRRVLQSVRI